MRRIPWATVLLVTPTIILTAASAAHPVIVLALRRDPQGLAAGQWWRLVSPVLVQPDPLWATVLVFAMVIAAGVACERAFSSSRAALLYLAGALTGQAAGYLWQPHGAGCSVAGCGWVGALAALWIGRPGLFRRIAVSWLLLALVDTFLRDIHGVPILAGALTGAALAGRGGRSATAGS